MADEAVIKRLNRAKGAAISVLKDAKFRIIPSDNSEFCILGVRKKEIRLIRVVVDEITAQDIKIVEDFDSLPAGICTKEIWCREEGQKKFNIKEID